MTSAADLSENQTLLPQEKRSIKCPTLYYPAPERLLHVAAVNRLIRQTHDERQGNIQSRNILIIKVVDPPSNSFAPNRDGLVGHDLRSHSQGVPARRKRLFWAHARNKCFREADPGSIAASLLIHQRGASRKDNCCAWLRKQLLQYS
jgi:hypothetical protein